jgi:hypothetical protein
MIAVNRRFDVVELKLLTSMIDGFVLPVCYCVVYETGLAYVSGFTADTGNNEIEIDPFEEAYGL